MKQATISFGTPAVSSDKVRDANSIKRPLPAAHTSIPADLEALSKAELISLVQCLAKERETTPGAPAKRAKASPAPQAAAAAPGLSAQERKKVLEKLGKNAEKAIKKTAHNDKKKPYSTLTEGIADKATALALLGDHGTVVSDSKKMHKRTMSPDEIVAWLGVEPRVHPVKFDGKVWCFAGGPSPKVYAHAAYESLEVKYEPSSLLLTLKFRTYLAGTGRPGAAFSDIDDY